MDLPDIESVNIKMEPGTQERGGGETPYTDIDSDPLVIKKECLEYAKSIDGMADIGVIKSEPETILKEDSRTSHCGAELLNPRIKKETEDASAVRCEPAVIAAKKHALKSGAISEIDFAYTVTEKECFVLLDRIDQNRDKLYTVCSIKFRKERSLARHEVIHTGEKPFACSACSFRASYKSHLVRHFRIHTGEKAFSCSECSYRCVLKVDLVSHERTHTGEKPFSCPVCTFRCSSKSSLNRHIKTHTGEKPFSCSECSFRCIEKPHLVRHERTHTGEKPFLCPVCTFRCSDKCNLKSHIRTHTGEKPFSCSVCSIAFPKKKQLVRHEITHS